MFSILRSTARNYTKVVIIIELANLISGMAFAIFAFLSKSLYFCVEYWMLSRASIRSTTKANKT